MFENYEFCSIPSIVNNILKLDMINLYKVKISFDFINGNLSRELTNQLLLNT